MSKKVGIVGIGKMGLPLALSLLEHGLTVYGYRRHMVDDFVVMGGTPVSSCKEVAQHADIVLTCLPTDEALLEAVSGENGLMYGAHPGLIVVEVSMLSIQAKEQAFTYLESVGVEMLDCPISGTPALVLPRKTVFFGSGNEEVFQHCLPVLKAITNNNFYLGGFGAGSKMKCVANLLVAVHNLAAAEALLGSIHQVREFIPLISALAREVESPTPLLNLVSGYYDRAVEEGRGEQDIVAMFSVLGKEAGIE